MNTSMLRLNNEEAVNLIETIQIAGGNPSSPFKGDALIVQVPDPADPEKEEFFLQLTPLQNLPKSTRFLRMLEVALTGGARVAAVMFVMLAVELSEGMGAVQIQPSPLAFILSLIVAIFLMVYKP